MEKRFQDESHLEQWLSRVLHTESRDSVYERNQIRLCGVTIPVLSQMNREQLKTILKQLLLPALPFLTYAEFDTFEDSQVVAEDVSYYDANDLQQLVNITPPEILFIDCSKTTVIWSTLTLQELHEQGLELPHIDLTPLLKHLVMGYFLHSEAPINYVITASSYSLQLEGQEPVTSKCRDSNPYARAYEDFRIQERAWQRAQVKERRRTE